MAPFGKPMAKTPLTLVKERFGDKQKLVSAVEKLATKDLWLDRVNADRGLGMISNAKLLRLHAALEDAQKRFGTRGKLVSAIQELEKRAKDDGYKTRLEKYPLPRLIDLHDSIAKRLKKADGKKPAATKKPEAVAKKPAAAKKASSK